MTDPKAIAREAFSRADELEREILSPWPDAWTVMDNIRTNPPEAWPRWCLLPMGPPPR